MKRKTTRAKSEKKYDLFCREKDEIPPLTVEELSFNTETIVMSSIVTRPRELISAVIRRPDWSKEPIKEDRVWPSRDKRRPD